MTTQITLDDYWIGRDKKYAKDLTDAIRANAKAAMQKGVQDLVAIEAALIARNAAKK